MSAPSDLQHLPGPASSRLGRWIAVAAVVAVCMLVYLPGLASIPPIDRDEARFAQASRQMVEGRFPGDWVVPRVQDEPRINKPPIIYWLQAGVATLLTGGDATRDAIWMYRIPSVLGATTAAVVTLWLGLSMFGVRVGLLAAVLLAVAPVVVFDAHQARADQVLLATTTLVAACLWQLWRRRHEATLPRRWTTLLWLGIGVGVLVKGPVTPVVIGGAAIALAFASGHWSWLWRLRPLSGVPIAVATALPWVLLAGHELGWTPLWERILYETVGRASTPLEGHTGPPGTHLVLLVPLFWPGSLLAGLGFLRAIGVAWRMPLVEGGGWFRRLAQRWRGRRVGRSAELFLLCWIVPGWLAFEIAMTKLPHYTLPMYPAIALLTARGVFAAARGWAEARTRVSRLGYGLWAVVGGAMVLAPAGLAAVALREGWLGAAAALSDPPLRFMPSHHGALAIGSLLACLLLVVVSVRLILAGRVLTGQLLALVPTVATLQILFGALLPGLAHAWISPRIAGELARVGAEARPFGAIEYQEDSLVYLTRGRVVRLAETDLDTWLDAHPDGVLLLPTALLDGTPRLRPLGAMSPSGGIRGWNYSKGRSVDLILAESAERDDPRSSAARSID